MADIKLSEIFKTSDEELIKFLSSYLSNINLSIYDMDNFYYLCVEEDFRNYTIKKLLELSSINPINGMYIDISKNEMPFGYFPYLRVEYDDTYSKEDAEAWNILPDIKHNPREIRSFLSMLKTYIDYDNILVNYDYPNKCLDANIYIKSMDTLENISIDKTIEFINRYGYVYPPIKEIAILNLNGEAIQRIINDQERLRKEKELLMKKYTNKN